MKTLCKLLPVLLVAALSACGETEAGEDIPTVEEARTEAVQADRTEIQERIEEYEARLRDVQDDLQEELAKLKDLDPKQLLEEGAAEVKRASERLQQEVQQLTQVVQVYREELQRKTD